MVRHDSRDPLYRTPSGARPTGSDVILRCRADDARAVTLRLWWDDGEIRRPMTASPRGAGLFEIRLTLPEQSGLLWYYFIVDFDGETRLYGNADDRLGGEGRLYDHEPPSFQLTVYDEEFDTPRWMREGLLYQIMPDRFAARGKNAPEAGWLHEKWDEPPAIHVDPSTHDNRADDFFGGNFRGVMDRLDYLKELGVTAIYFNPIFRARSNHKYDTGDYETIDPSFGTREDFEALCGRARALGIRILLDGVFSHTGSDSRYFNRLGRYDSLGAYQSMESPYASWYRFKRWPDEYDCWWGFETLPTVNKSDESYRRYILTGENAIVKRWLRRGASGWRLDVADELPVPFLRTLRKSVKSVDPDAAVLGEVWEDASNKVAYGQLRCYCLGDTLDSVMNYPLREGLIGFLLGEIDAYALKRRLDALYENYPAPFAAALMNLLGSHDKARVINRLSGAEPENRPREQRAFTPLSDAEYERGKRRFIKAWRFLCAMPGMPCLYYGDEAGAQGGDDPFCRGTYPWGHEDRALMEEIKRVNHARLKSRAAQNGSLELIAPDADTLTVVRRYESDELRVTLDRRDD
ncbi:MAG: glycoside hydrolase family 13 protein [Clostridiales bacterium]|nr:glycoside hydrolase family 13 protein [Clostridiales bacterium]MDY2873095.1 glycoside hydrolase family 13 protein [Eubacteriales bacterium]